MDLDEHQLNFLIKASGAVSIIQNKETKQIMRSFYLTRYKQATGSTKLPQKQFSSEVRCPRCSIEWTRDTERRVKPIKLSKRQRRRIRSNGKVKNKSANKDYLLHSNILEKVCSFCNHTTKIPIIKPNKTCAHIEEEKSVDHPKIPEKQIKMDTTQNNDKKEVDVYSKSNEVFSLSKHKNTLSSHIKEPPKIIKNNKRKKDKFAGLCQTAVIAATKLKEEKEKQNKLNLFLKPSN
ncbi:uncharacterized protein LOC112053997 [Bicyclus anynana]|uniref:Uncharacterized protein LOC112053997 n=1 Tax=Bicyclus anynana TaxID=110368 RepID=A0A6J1NW16_BICAN|nr:uncharacterized protein LOC112053997 [Bicyclus anynana]